MNSEIYVEKETVVFFLPQTTITHDLDLTASRMTFSTDKRRAHLTRS